MQAMGMVETKGLIGLLAATDAMMKAANVQILKRSRAVFDLHPLVLEDIVNTNHRPKLEAFDDYLFVVLQMLRYDARQSMIHTEQVSLVHRGRHAGLFPPLQMAWRGRLKHRRRTVRRHRELRGADTHPDERS